jgi:hypothetical protein
MKELHPIAAALPQFDADQLPVLADDIRVHGLREPIVLYEDKVLDGQNRQLACELAGVEPRYVEYTGDDPVGLVVSANLHRRHLNADNGRGRGEAGAALRRGGAGTSTRWSQNGRKAPTLFDERPSAPIGADDDEHGKAAAKAAEAAGYRPP